MFIELKCAYSDKKYLVNFSLVEYFEESNGKTYLFYDTELNSYIVVIESLNEIQSKLGRKLVVGN